MANVEEINKEVSKSKIKEAESQYGCRYSVLLDVPYFNPIDLLPLTACTTCILDQQNMHSKYGLIRKCCQKKSCRT